MKRITIVLLAAIVLLGSCMHGHRVKGNGHVITENKQFGDITGVDLGSDFNVYLTEGSPSNVRIEAEENIMTYIDMHVENGVLNIDTRNDVWLNNHKDVNIYITTPHYNKIAVSGSGNITGQTKITNDSKLDLGCSGSGNMKLEVDAPEITTGVSGSGEMELTGETKKFSADVSGSGDIKAFDLKAEEASLQVSGSGSVNVFSSVKLSANISGSGDVRYKGNAQVNSNTSGSGEVKKVD
jgi:hypothetical protein